MTPVINPWVFYWMSVADSLWVGFTVTWIVSMLIAIGIGIIIITDGFYEDAEKKAFRCMKRMFIVAVVTFLIATFIPTQDTIVKMVIAQNITVDGVEIVSNTVVDIYNDIMGLFQEAVANGG